MMLNTISGLPLSFYSGENRPLQQINDIYYNQFDASFTAHNQVINLPSSLVGKKGLVTFDTLLTIPYHNTIAKLGITVNDLSALSPSINHRRGKYYYFYTLQSLPSNMICGVSFIFVGSGNWSQPPIGFEIRMRIYY